MDDYQVQVVWHPAHELLTSLHAYVSPPLHKVAELGAAWRKSVKQNLPSGYADRLAELAGTRQLGVACWLAFAVLWSWQTEPQSASQSVDDFLTWAESLSTGDLYTRTVEQLPQIEGAQAEAFAELTADLQAHRQTMVALLRGWYEGYFRTVDPEILAALGRDAAAQSKRASTAHPRELIESITRGMVVSPGPEIDTIALIPQYHAQPWNTFEHLRRTIAICYPVEALPPAPGDPSPRLLRLTRALDDASRLRILRYIAAAPRGFSEIVAELGLAKSTIHHHLVLLRAAGLVRVETSMGQSYDSRYSLSPAGLDELVPELRRFLGLHSETGTGEGNADERD
jgi:DNA-binding transcriptional ArsR family regulator